MTDNPHYVTPEEAEKMGCPLSMGGPEFAASCIGKTCMAWRWRIDRYDYDDAEATELPVAIFSKTHGYCGMVRHD